MGCLRTMRDEGVAIGNPLAGETPLSSHKGHRLRLVALYSCTHIESI